MILTEEPINETIKSAKLLFTSQLGKNLVSLYRLDKNYFLVHYDKNRVTKTEKISKALAHLIFPNLIVR
jgi:hypothetical protein